MNGTNASVQAASPSGPADVATDLAVDQLRAMARRMQAAIQDSAGRSATGGPMTLADLAGAQDAARIASGNVAYFGAQVVDKYPHLAWFEPERSAAAA
jgi:hypothetical protein